ncbi:hypothetical protein L596_010025 [Steinernema carpocapsae]|uniref:G-protein coupled receptors family 1 profile domain-containing protein n=2 Tax=Steinernema carpocapsae TaxID=34508 RepID=A0A4U5PH31_STECR|nr:hypothetical protein L596_010025 [Steinernema carpocapsae]
MLITATIALDTFFLSSQIFSVIYSAMGVIGILGNLIIVATTLSSEKLRATCNILIAIEALCGTIIAVLQLDFTYFSYAKLLMPQSLCYWIALPCVVALDFEVIIVLSIALERYLCTSYPVFHKRINTKGYVGIACSCATIYAASFRILAYFTVMEVPVICIAPFATIGVALNIWIVLSFFINVGVILLYLLIRRKLKGSGTEMADYHKINKSLQTHVCVYLFGWASVFTLCILVMVTVEDPLLTQALLILLGPQVYMNMCSSFFVYYFRSTLYKQEIRRFLRLDKMKVYTKVFTVSTFSQNSKN